MGCVNVIDCLSQEEYIDQYPDGENENPFIFICTDPKMMITHFPIKGQNKICNYIHFFFFFKYTLIDLYKQNTISFFFFFTVKLDEKIHNAAQKCLMKESY